MVEKKYCFRLKLNAFSETTVRPYQELSTSTRPSHNMNMRSNRQMSLQTMQNYNNAGIYLESFSSATTRNLSARESQNKEEAIYMTIDDDA